MKEENMWVVRTPRPTRKFTFKEKWSIRINLIKWAITEVIENW